MYLVPWNRLSVTLFYYLIIKVNIIVMIMNIINGSMMITSPRPLYNNTAKGGRTVHRKNTNTTISQLGWGLATKYYSWSYYYYY